MATKPKLASLFTGKDTKAEEKKEAQAVKSGKISPAQYARGEKAEEKREKEKGERPKSTASLLAKAKDMKSGKLTPAQYAAKEAKK